MIPSFGEEARRALLPAAAVYFLRAKGRTGRPWIRWRAFTWAMARAWNGSNILGDVSPKALRQSHGLMVNYCYDLDDIEANHEAYAEKGVVAAAKSVHRALPSHISPRDLAAQA